MTTVLVIGASRGIGLEAVRQGLDHGFTVRAMARNPDNMAIDHPALETVKGDALDPADVAGAVSGADAVILALGVAAGPQMVLGPVRLFSKATRILLPAMEAAGVRRLIAVTGFGAGDSRHKVGCLQEIPFRAVLGRAYADKTIQETLIRDSDLDWVIARPTILTRGPKTGRYRVLDDPRDWRNGVISRADVADFLIRQVADDTYLRKTPVLTY